MNNNFGLSDKTINELREYFSSSQEIELVKIYGSRAKGNFHNGSDIDLAIWTDAHEKFFKFAGELNDLPTPYKFDVIDFKTLAHEGLKRSIERDGIVFYKQNN